MPVSDWLQKHFDKTWPGKKQIHDRLQKIQWQIDPAFMKSFEKFRHQVLCIVDDTPGACSIVDGEIVHLETKLERVNQKKQVKTFETVADNT